MGGFVDGQIGLGSLPRSFYSQEKAQHRSHFGSRFGGDFSSKSSVCLLAFWLEPFWLEHFVNVAIEDATLTKGTEHNAQGSDSRLKSKKNAPRDERD